MIGLNICLPYRTGHLKFCLARRPFAWSIYSPFRLPRRQFDDESPRGGAVLSRTFLGNNPIRLRRSRTSKIRQDKSNSWGPFLSK
jgi:hypothetical protein